MTKRIAFYGRPGAGKSTSAGMLEAELNRRGLAVVRLRLATPLYELQARVYEAAGRPLAEESRQDGMLLNALAADLRRINPTALTDRFTREVTMAAMEAPDAVVLCDDMRAPDVDSLAELGFRMVQVWAPDDLRQRRKAGRADLAPGDENHPTEAEITITPHWRIENTGSLELLRARMRELALEMTP